MKKMAKILAVALLAMCLTAGAVGCQKSDDKGSNNDTSAAETQTGFVGTWTMKIDENALAELSAPEEQKQQTKALMASVTMTIELKEDGKAVLSMMGQGMDTTWTEKDGKLTIAATEKKEGGSTMSSQEMTLVMDGNKLVPDESMKKSEPAYGVVYFEKG